MKIDKDDNLSSGYRILGSNNWGIEEDKLCIYVSNAEILPLSLDDMCINVYGDGPRQIAEDIIELSRNPERKELDTLKAENESLKETIEVLQRQLEKERSKQEMESNRLRKRNNKLKQDFESIKGHLRTAQHKLDKYERDKHYSEIFVANHPGQSLTFKNAKMSVSDNGDVTVSGQSVENLIDRLEGLIETEVKFTEWQDIVLKQVEANPGIFNEPIKEK